MRRTPLLSPAATGSRARHVCRAREEGESERTTQLRKYRRRRSPPLCRSRVRLLARSATRESAFSTTQFPSRRSPSLPTLPLPPEMYSRSPVLHSLPAFFAEMGTRDEILRGFFHRENRILLRKSHIFDLNTILYSQSCVLKKFKKPDLLGLWKNPLTIPCLVGTHYLFTS